MTIPEAFQTAVYHHQAGRLAEAEALYKQILAVQPSHTGALHFLGVAAQQVGRNDLAVDLIGQSIAIDPNNATAHCNLGNALLARRHIDEAIAAYRRALQVKPDYAMAHNNMGNALTERGLLEEAAAACRRALELKPDFPEAHNNLGNALARQGRPEEAIAEYRRALALNPDHPEAHHNLGNVLWDMGQLDEAIASCRRAIELKPKFPDAYNTLGVALRMRGQLDEALAAFHHALALEPSFAEAHNSLGNALWERGQLDEAVSACHRALELRPNFPEAQNNLGNALRECGRLDEAIAAFRSALQMKPDYASAHSNLVYTLHFHPGHDIHTISEEHRRWNRQFGDPVKELTQPHFNDRSPERKLRIGYVSPDFRDHPVGRYVLPLLDGHDRERFEILCYSGSARADWMTERLGALTGAWRSTVGVPDSRLAEMIREDGVDILVDLALHTAGNRLLMFARQPAPVQVAWLGYPGSAGLPGIGYRLTDAHMDPPGERPAWSAEEPVRMPDCWCCYQQSDDSPAINALPALSANAVTFGSLNNFTKVNDGVLKRWARVLAAVKGSRLLMFCPKGQAREQVRTFFGARGIAAERVEFASFLSRSEYLKLYQRIDLGLDPSPCNGMTTTCDALWMGVPVLTLPGELPVSRAGLSLLSSIGLEELVAPSEEDYVRIATELAADLPRLAEMRASLRPRMKASPLMDAPRFAWNVEAAYRNMWRTWCAGHSPILGA